MSSQFEVIIGTYEQFLLGYQVNDVINKYKMERTFATHSHIASIRSIASNKHYLASGAADDTVCLYDMRNRTENGKLIHHNDTVNCISFTPDASHIITGSSDGTLAIVRCGNWQIEKHFQSPHKGFSVDALAVHPTGKLALSTGGDGVLRTWNLVKGRQAYATNLVPRWKMDAKYVSVLKWSPDGKKYLVAANNKIDVYVVETAGIIDHITCDTKIICIEFLNDNLFAVGLSNGKVVLYDLENGSQTFETLAHDARVKSMVHYDDFLVTASSAGEIKLWSFTKDNLTMLNKTNCHARISCLALHTPYKKNNINIEEEEDVLEDKETEKRVEEEDEEGEEKYPKKWIRTQKVIVEDEGEENMKPKKKKCKTKRSKPEEEREFINEQSPKKKRKKNNSNINTKKRKDIDASIPMDFISKNKNKTEEVNDDIQLKLKKRKSLKYLDDETKTAKNQNIEMLSLHMEKNRKEIKKLTHKQDVGMNVNTKKKRKHLSEDSNMNTKKIRTDKVNCGRRKKKYKLHK